MSKITCQHSKIIILSHTSTDVNTLPGVYYATGEENAFITRAKDLAQARYGCHRKSDKYSVTALHPPLQTSQKA